MVNETMVDGYNEKRIQELETINAELLEALEAALAELHECAMELTGEPYNNPETNNIIANAKGAAR